MNLLAQSLRDFSSDAWWSVCNTLIDYESAELWMLTENVRKEVRRGDLLRASLPTPCYAREGVLTSR